MTRLERTTRLYWQLARLARHDTFLSLVVRGLDGLAMVARTAPSYRLRLAAAAHVGVAARAHRFLNAETLERAAMAMTTHGRSHASDRKTSRSAGPTAP